VIITFQIISAFASIFMYYDTFIERSITFLTMVRFILTFISNHEFKFIGFCDFIRPIFSIIFILYNFFILFFFVCLLNSIKKFHYALSVKITNFCICLIYLLGALWIESTLIEFFSEIILSGHIEPILFLF